ncbi:MAG: hypothetical protein ACOC6B_01800, partial [Thermodesulfobacteriota bacterium]
MDQLLLELAIAFETSFSERHRFSHSAQEDTLYLSFNPDCVVVGRWTIGVQSNAISVFHTSQTFPTRS